jgi:hypothetical protein
MSTIQDLLSTVYPVYGVLSFLISSGGVILSPLSTSATIWPIVPVSDDDECEAVGGILGENLFHCRFVHDKSLLVGSRLTARVTAGPIDRVSRYYVIERFR